MLTAISQIFIKSGSPKKLSMNAEQFEKFINERQRDVRLNELIYPYLTIKQASELIHKFEIDESFKKKSLFHSDKFLFAKRDHSSFL